MSLFAHTLIERAHPFFPASKYFFQYIILPKNKSVYMKDSFGSCKYVNTCFIYIFLGTRVDLISDILDLVEKDKSI